MDTGRQLTESVVRPSLAARHFDLRRHRPAPPLDRFLDRFWVTEWDLAEPFVQPIVTYPVVNLVIQADGSATLSGVQTTVDQRRIEARGWAIGMMFRPGGFSPFHDRPVADLTDRRVDPRDVFGPALDGVVAAVLDADGDEERIERFSRLLIPLVPAGATTGEALADLIETAVDHDPPVTRTDDLARRFGVSARTLQRLFARHVGIGPKAVLARYRVLAAAGLATGPVGATGPGTTSGPVGATGPGTGSGPVDWAEVAARLGYADQAHLTADLSATYGMSPAAYARSEAAAEEPAPGARPASGGGGGRGGEVVP